LNFLGTFVPRNVSFQLSHPAIFVPFECSLMFTNKRKSLKFTMFLVIGTIVQMSVLLYLLIKWTNVWPGEMVNVSH